MNKYDMFFFTQKPDIVKAAFKKFRDFGYYRYFTGQGGDWRFCLLMCLKHDYEDNDIAFLLEIRFITQSQARALRTGASAAKHIVCACMPECHIVSGECQLLVNTSPAGYGNHIMTKLEQNSFAVALFWYEYIIIHICSYFINPYFVSV